MAKILDKCRSNFEKIAILEDFNLKPTNPVMTTFMTEINFVNIIQ